MGRVREAQRKLEGPAECKALSGGALFLLYSAAVTVRFFDAGPLALFACDLKDGASEFCLAPQAWRRDALQRPGRAKHVLLASSLTNCPQAAISVSRTRLRIILRMLRGR